MRDKYARKLKAHIDVNMGLKKSVKETRDTTDKWFGRPNIAKQTDKVLERTLCCFRSCILYGTEAIPLGLSSDCLWRGKSPSFYPSNPLFELGSAYLNHSLG